MTPAVPRPALWLLVVMTGLGPFSMQILIPALPVMAADLSVPYGVAQLTLTLFLIGVAFGQLLYGPLSDRFGRRPVLLWALALYITASALSALAPSMAWLGIGRVAQAMGACSGMVLGRAIIRDAWPREEAASRIGYVVMAMTLAPMIAPTAGALIQEQAGWRGCMLACLLFGVPLFLAVRLRLPETLREPQPLPGLPGLGRAYMSLLRVPAFLYISAVGAASTGVFFTFMAGAPLVTEALGYTPRHYAAAFLSTSVLFALGSWLAGRYSSRMGLARMLSAGLWVMVAGALIMLGVQLLLPHTLMGFFLPMGVVALGNGISLPNAVAAAVSVRPERAGTASGLLGATQMGFGALMTLVNGAVEEGSGIATPLVMVGCVALAAFGMRGARRYL